jgi:hypothetical protein
MIRLPMDNIHGDKKELSAEQHNVFVYHNSAPSYYGAGGFRGLLRI